MPYGDAAGAAAAPQLIQQLRAPLFARIHGGCVGPGTYNQPVQRHLNDWLSTLDADPLVFYVTVDVVTTCTTLVPTDPAYWNGVASNRNVLVGNVYYVNEEQHFSESYPAVNIEASTSQGPSTLGFYQSRTGVEDNREPLPTAFGLPFQNETGVVSSEIMLWKNSTELYSSTPVADQVIDCAGYLYYAWDEDEHTVVRGCSDCWPEESIDIDPNLFPFMTQMVPLTIDNFDLPDKYGWMLLVMPPSYDQPFSDTTPGNNTLLQKYMGWAALRTYYGSHSTMTPAWTMANAHCNPAERLPDLGRTGQ